MSEKDSDTGAETDQTAVDDDALDKVSGGINYDAWRCVTCGAFHYPHQ